jgi:EAL domain-containing protein (putative c-di-GMP-specific phosphodiesterase class I)/PleD family two-component response regulator
MSQPLIDDLDTLFVFADDEPVVDRDAGGGGSWRVLIVDDDADVHRATELALRDLIVEGRPLVFEHAFDSAQAYALLQAHADTAVMMLDVVMESEHAGLELVHRVREELGRHELRIILRTGQPGYAPELETIRRYDINDYKTKAELTRVRLYTSLTVAVRSYRQLHRLEATRRGLEAIIDAGIDLGRLDNMQRFAQGVVTQLCALFDVAPEGLVCAVSGHRGRHVVAAAGQYSGYIGKPIGELPDAVIRDAIECAFAERRSRSGAGHVLYFPVDAIDGVVAYVSAPHDPARLDTRLLEVFVMNITAGFDKLVLHQRITELAYLDLPSKLPNRNAMLRWIDEGGDGERVVAFVDIDDFAEINSILDQAFGDKVLRAVASRIEQLFGGQARVARIGADVFGILGPPEVVHAAAIDAIFDTAFDVGGFRLRLSASSGLARCRDEAPRGDLPLRDAGVAAKRAKALARGGSVYYDAAQAAAARDRMLLLSELRDAFDAGRLALAYQPVFELDGGAIVGVEALLRWQRSDGSSVPPALFIPLAEESGLIVDIGDWVLRTALTELGALRALAGAGFRMAINISPAQFREPDFVQRLDAAIGQAGVSHADVEIELTESMAIENLSFIVDVLTKVRALGVGVAIDDFGTGYSSLSVIRQLPFDRLKIDRSFVQDMESDRNIVQLILRLAGALGVKTLAEGIETAQQLDVLRELGCSWGQGYLVSPPLPADALRALLRKRRAPTQPADAEPVQSQCVEKPGSMPAS